MHQNSLTLLLLLFLGEGSPTVTSTKKLLNKLFPSLVSLQPCRIHKPPKIPGKRLEGYLFPNPVVLFPVSTSEGRVENYRENLVTLIHTVFHASAPLWMEERGENRFKLELGNGNRPRERSKRQGAAPPSPSSLHPFKCFSIHRKQRLWQMLFRLRVGWTRSDTSLQKLSVLSQFFSTAGFCYNFLAIFVYFPLLVRKAVKL